VAAGYMAWLHPAGWFWRAVGSQQVSMKRQLVALVTNRVTSKTTLHALAANWFPTDCKHGCHWWLPRKPAIL